MISEAAWVRVPRTAAAEWELGRPHEGRGGGGRAGAAWGAGKRHREVKEGEGSQKAAAGREQEQREVGTGGLFLGHSTALQPPSEVGCVLSLSPFYRCGS